MAIINMLSDAPKGIQTHQSISLVSEVDRSSWIGLHSCFGIMILWAQIRYQHHENDMNEVYMFFTIKF